MLKNPFNMNGILIHLMFDRRNKFEFVNFFLQNHKIYI